jgi:hypothetical protein
MIIKISKFFSCKINIIKLILINLIPIISIIKINSQTQINNQNQIKNLTQNLDLIPYDDDTRYYASEICSFNQKNIKYDKDKNSITCICKEGYLTYYTNKILKFGNHLIQCNYRKKRGYIVFFYSVFSLFGFEHFYLGRYKSFIFLFTLYLGTILVNFYFIITAYFKTDFTKDKVIIIIIKRLFEKMFYVWYFVYIGNLILVLTHSFNDGNGQEIMWDFYEFISE